MRKFGGGRATRASITVAVLIVVGFFYGFRATESWRMVFVVALAVALLLALFWAFARTRSRRKERFRHRALRDSLTNLLNRSSFEERTEHALVRAARESRSVAVLVVDLDDFEEVNHGLGHEAGDRLLTVVGRRLEESVSPIGGTVARLCGDEFAVLLEDVPGRVPAAAAKRIEKVLKVPVELGAGEVLVSASVGVAVGVPGEQDDDPKGLLRKADAAMHAAKRKGKARHKIYDPGADTTTSGRLLAEVEMRRAIEKGELRVYYQPLVELGSGKVRGVEALVRWQHPVYGLVPPGEFVPLAEQTGLITPIGRWVLEEACRQVRLWQKEHPDDPPLELSANVSPHQFRQANLAQEVLRILERAGLDPRYLKLEITESVMVQEAAAEAALQELKDSGVKLAMDDFGTGYSNLSYVKRLPVDTLKIDRSYVAGLGTNAEDTAIVHATVVFAEALGLKVTAEGIENAEQMARLRELGCELGQGYHFSKPLPGEQVQEFLMAYPIRPPATDSG